MKELIGPRQRILVLAGFGCVPYLLTELQAMGLNTQESGDTHAITEGDFSDAMRLCLHLRTAQRVLYRLASFRANTPDELYNAVRAIAWERIIDPRGYVSITSSVVNPTIRDSRYPNLKVKDALMDRMRDKTGRRPDSGPLRDKTVLHLHWKDSECSLYLDASGEPLSKRGYRLIPMDAPMQESLAAAVVMATGWDGKQPFVNPMCGSGTLAIEAALMASHRAPGLTRDNFGFMHIAQFEGYREAWAQMLAHAKGMVAAPECRIIATDISRKAVDAAIKNARAAGVNTSVDKMIEFSALPFEETAIPSDSGVILMNPEYGQRLGDEAALTAQYALIGDYFKQRCAGHTGFVFTGNMELAKRIGLRASRRMAFNNGPIECRLLRFELYAGSKKRGLEI